MSESKQDKKFRSASGQDIRIATLGGHIATVGGVWRQLPECLWADAYRSGCISDDMDVFKELKGNEVAYALANKKVAEDGLLKEVVAKLIEKNSPDDFLKSGKVDALSMTQAYGKPVSAARRDEIWDKGGYSPVLFEEVITPE